MSVGAKVERFNKWIEMQAALAPPGSEWANKIRAAVVPGMRVGAVATEEIDLEEVGARLAPSQPRTSVCASAFHGGAWGVTWCTPRGVTKRLYPNADVNRRFTSLCRWSSS